MIFSIVQKCGLCGLVAVASNAMI